MSFSSFLALSLLKAHLSYIINTHIDIVDGGVQYLLVFFDFLFEDSINQQNSLFLLVVLLYNIKIIFVQK